MCGIAGYVGPRPVSHERIQNCLGLMRRRGPDAAGSRTFVTPDGRHVHLLHSRLSIIDLDERSNQPQGHGGTWLSYNGELYNYLEVRDRLAAGGEPFATTSDTEVMLRVLQREGWQGLDGCEGMWALAAYDEATGTLRLARDRFGEKPLYSFRDGDAVYFGSEVKFIAALRGRPLEIEPDHVRRFLVNGYKALYRSTFFKGLEALTPGTVRHLSATGETTTPYWTVGPADEDAAMTYADAVAGTRERLIRAVELRLRADVPLAFCMSGGVDSNALISIAKVVFGYDVHGFTIANSDARYEETALVEHAVAALGLRHTTIPLETAGFLERLRVLVRQHDAPVSTISYYTHWLLMESIAAHGYRISVSGTAADELFTGYYDHHLAYLAAVAGDRARHAGAVSAWERRVKPIVRNPFLSDPTLFVNRPDFRDHIYLDAAEFSSFLQSPWHEPFAETAYTSPVLRNRMLNELFHEIVPVILHEDDLNAMYFSIENRSPFLDRALFEFTRRIPTAHLLRDGYAKAVLRDSMRGIVPDAILDSARKVGFNAPIFSLLDVKSPAVRASLLEPSPIFDIVRREPIEALCDRPDLPNSESKFLFSFLASKMFLEEFAA